LSVPLYVVSWSASISCAEVSFANSSPGDAIVLQSVLPGCWNSGLPRSCHSVLSDLRSSLQIGRSQAPVTPPCGAPIVTASSTSILANPSRPDMAIA
jgi:hypothetical protein